LLGTSLNQIFVRNHLTQGRRPQYELVMSSPFRDSSNKNSISKVQLENSYQVLEIDYKD